MFAGQISSSHHSDIEAVDWENVGKALSPFHPPDATGLWRSDKGALFCQQQRNLPESRDVILPVRDSRGHVAVAFWGRLDNRAELCSHLGLSQGSLGDLSDSQLLLAAWREWGELVPQRLQGDFALAIVDAARGTVLLARDAFGTKPLFFTRAAGHFTFATSVAGLRAVKGLDLSPSQTWMVRYLAEVSANNVDTAYEEVSKVPPGHSLYIDELGHGVPRRWFHLRDDAPRYEGTSRNSAWVDAYEPFLQEAVRCRTRSDFPIGTEISGGLDTSTVTAYAARLIDSPGNQLHGFGHCFRRDEPAFILQTSQTAGIRHNHLLTTSGSYNEFKQYEERAINVIGYPVEHSEATFNAIFYQECQHRKIRTLLSGFGGDEAVTIPGSRQLRLELWDAHLWRQFWNILPGNPLTRTLRALKFAAAGHKSPKYNLGFMEARDSAWAHLPLRQETIRAFDLEHTSLDFVRFDAPYRRINDFILQYSIHAPYVTARFENCTLLAASYGVEYRWPLWDARLIQQFLSTPSYEKVGPGGVGRYLHRRAVNKILPHRVVWDSTKDMGGLVSRPQHLDSVTCLKAAQETNEHLHTSLEPIIDRNHFLKLIRYVQTHTNDEDSIEALTCITHAISMLNYWLYQHSRE